MKQIAFFPNGGISVIDTDSEHMITINSEEPIELIEYNKENMLKYFGINIEEEKSNTKIHVK